MRSLSEEARELLASSHRVVVAAQAADFPAGQARSYKMGLRADLAVAGGTVDIDYEAAVRRRCTVRLADPAPALDGTVTVGSEVRLFRGVRLADGTDELVPLGVFDVGRIQTTLTGAGPQVTLEGYDRARRAARDRVVHDFPWPNGFAAHQALLTLLVQEATVSSFPLITMRFDDGAFDPLAGFPATSATNPLIQAQLWRSGADRWQLGRDLAASIGQDLFYDVDGVPWCVTVPDWTAASPVWRFVDGDGGTLVEAARDVDSERAYNGVLMTGGSILGVAAPAAVEVFDNNPQSPTYRDGPYGAYYDFASNTATVDPAVLLTAATTRLRRHQGRLEEVTVTAVCNPALDVGDCVLIDAAAADVAASYIAVRATIPLEPDQPMRVTCWPKRALA